MKNLMLSSLLTLCACASSSGALGSRSAADSIAGPWRGVLVRGEVRNVADFRFEGRAGAWRGSYWGRTLVPIELTHLEVGDTIHFEVPHLATFDGRVGDDTIVGTFRDDAGEGSFQLVKEVDPDDSGYTAS